MCNFWNYSEATEIICFDGKGREGIFGQAEDGIIVFVDRDMGVQVQEGETWICRLSRSRNPDKKIYWAWPIQRIEMKEETAADGAAEETGTEAIEAMAAEDGITAEGQDRISSGMFTGNRYMAYRSLNGAFMELIEDPAGDIVCKDGSMAIEGLDVFIGTQFPVALVFTRRENGFLIKLEQ